ncbi:MAG: hypothetical protein DDT35_00473 [Firmicutes bacterium]|nr:hypothetical protein [Bacillota bacterium]
MDYRKIKVQAVILNGQYVLMTRVPGGIWTLPGGEVEEGETPDTALERVVNEATGCAIKVTKHLSREKVNEEDCRLRLTFLAEGLSKQYDPKGHGGPLQVDWRSLRSPELKELIYDKHLAGKERV